MLALVGRLEAREWIDVLASSERIQELGFLAWAACGKDPGFSPPAILEHAARSARYPQAEISALEFEGPSPDAAELARRWHGLLAEARGVVAVLPLDQVGTCVLDAGDELFRGDAESVRDALGRGAAKFRTGSIRGVLPEVRTIP